MNEKITMQDLIEQVAKKHGMMKKDAEAFVRGLFELIEDALATENYVKIKGLGTFKLTEVDSRESVNVNTGERIEIQGHSKITFTPDSTMKDLINKPFAHFETVLLNEGTRTEDMEAEVLDVVETLAAEAPIVETPVVEEPVIEQIPIEEPAPQPVEEEVVITPVEGEPKPVQEEIAAVEEEEKPEKEALSEPEPVVEETKEEEASAVIPSVEEESSEGGEERKTPWGIIAAIVLILCLVGGIYWYMQSASEAEEPVAPAPTVVELSQEPVPATAPLDTLVQGVQADSIAAIQPQQDAPAPVKKDAPKVILNDTIEYEITGTKTTLALQPGETLVKLALRFYGTKNLWHYIVQHNRDVIQDADRVPIGTTLRIPELSPKK